MARCSTRSPTDPSISRVFGVAFHQRTGVPYDPVTTTAVEQPDVATIPTFHTSVSAVSPLNDRLVEIELDGGLDEFTSLGGDQFFYLMVPRPGGEPIPTATRSPTTWPR